MSREFETNMDRRAAYSYIEARDILTKEIQNFNFKEATIESMPFRAYPDWNSPDLAWDGEGFQGGYLFADQLFQELSTILPVKHILLIDDYMHDAETLSERHNKDSKSDKEFINETLEAVQDYFIKPLSLFSHIDQVFLESNIGRDNKVTSRIERDKYFQLKKDLIDPNKLHIVIHGKSYRIQQMEMMDALYKKNTIINHESVKEQVTKGITRYRHIWITNKGGIANITEPYLTDNHVKFQSIRRN
jgi:hypothetical protein